jgi:4-amino-4-deoxy-L-arabinose transferase-like glycosyltransferase
VVLTVFGVALLLRLAYVLPLSPQKLSLDAYEWMDFAMRVATGSGYGDAWRPPGYITFLAGIFFVFGKSIIAVRIIQAILGALSCVLLYFVAKKTFSKGAATIASVLMCFYPYLIAYTGDLLSETFYTFMILLAVFLTLQCAEKPSYKNIVLTGIVFGLTGLVKATVMPFFLFSCAWLWYSTKKFRVGFLVGIFTLIAISPWTLRNHFYYKKVIPISTMWMSVYIASSDNAMLQESMGELDTPQPNSVMNQAIPADYPELLKLPRMEQEKIYKQKSIEWIKNNPDKLAWLLKKRLIHFWRLYPMQAFRWQKIAAILTSGIYLPLGLIGIFLSYRYYRKTMLFAALFVIFTVVHIFFLLVMRYRVPIDPYIIMFAAFTINGILIRGKSILKPQVNTGGHR